MKKLSVAILGLGTVGRGVYDTIHRQQTRLQTIVGSSVHISSILVEHPEKHQNMTNEIRITTDIRDIINDPNIDVVFEAIVGKEPAYSYLKQCLQAGKHVITANKEMFAAHGKELKRLATDYQVGVGFDATTAGGIPIIQTIQHVLHANQIQRIEALLNGTSNYILTQMREKGSTFSDSLKEAQQLGFAEANPTNDIEGYDAFYKLKILSELIFNEQPLWNDVKRIGITQITSEEVRKQTANGKRIKHIAQITLSNGILAASIEPKAISAKHPLYAVEGVNNAIHLETDIVGGLTLTGPGAGAFPTASAMIEDFCQIFKQHNVPREPAII